MRRFSSQSAPLGDRQSEQDAEEEEEDYGMRDPEQADGDIETEYERKNSYDVARRDRIVSRAGMVVC